MYEQSASLAQFFMHSESGKKRAKFIEYLKIVTSGAGAAGTWEQCFGKKPAGMQGEFEAYVKGLKQAGARRTARAHCPELRRRRAVERSMTTARIGVLLVALGCGAFTAAEDPPPPAESLDEILATLNRRRDGWEDFAPGSWVEYRAVSWSDGTKSVDERRWTLIGRDPNGPVLDSRPCVVKIGADGREVRELGDATRYPGVASLKVTYSDLKDLRRDRISVLGAPRECRVLEAEMRTEWGFPGVETQRSRQLVRLWRTTGAPEPGKLVRTENDSTDAPGFGPTTSDAWLFEEGREVRVGDRTFHCTVWRHAFASKGEKSVGSGEHVTCPGIPGGIAGSKNTTRTKSGTSWSIHESVTEVIGFEAKPGSKD